MTTLVEADGIAALAECLGCPVEQVHRAIELFGTNEELVRKYLCRLGYVSDEKTRTPFVCNATR